MKEKFKLVTSFRPTGDQPQAIEKLATGVKEGLKHQVLLGVTGSGKTFTIANVIKKIQKPTLVISHNKTLAAQLFQEFREFFPQNAICYFVSYYDYYQPEAYIPQRDQYIAKEVAINELIDKLRLLATTSLLTRRDVIVVASVSCIYNLGSPVEYGKAIIKLKVKSEKLKVEDLPRRLVELYYERSDFDFKRGTFRVRGEVADIWPSYQDEAIRIEFTENGIKSIKKLIPVTGNIKEEIEAAVIYPAKHFITARERYRKALEQIKKDLKLRVKELEAKGKNLEAHRLKQRTNYDLEMIKEIGYCNGIENYSRYFDGRRPGEPPYTLLDYFHLHQGQALESSRPGLGDFLVIIDESHMTVPQIRGMYKGDKSRKETLIKYGFRLPSALDNRPLKFDEFLERVPQIIYTSATPARWEMNEAIQSTKAVAATHASPKSGAGRAPQLQMLRAGVVEQLIRPTGLLDPEIKIRPTKGQIEDLIKEIDIRVRRRERILVTTLTKRMAEDLASFLEEKGIKVHYLHADVETLERTDILEDLRRGKYDVVVGINLLREGLDLPEVSLVAILDADKEGFLRSETSLIQVMGRAARHVSGKVIMYADNITGSMRRAIREVNRRRQVQLEYNKKQGITPRSIVKPIRAKLITDEKKTTEGTEFLKKAQREFKSMPPGERRAFIRKLEWEMKEAAEILDFEKAAFLRDQIKTLKAGLDSLS